MIEVEGLEKEYGDKVLFKDLTFKLPPNGIVGVIGPNGAGKSTLFKLITGQETPDAGSIRLGETVKLAYVDQSRDDLDPDKTVWQEISGGLDVHEGRQPRDQHAAPTSARSTSRAATSRRRSASSPAASATACTWPRP